MKKILLSGIALMAFPAVAMANCPAVTVDNPMGIAVGDYPQQYELSAFEAAASCEMSFSTNPEIAMLNARIHVTQIYQHLRSVFLLNLLW